MNADEDTEEPRVLAIASHVSYGYVGNKLVSFVLQSLGYDVSAINTVHFSNHTAYKQFAGRKTSASEIQDLYDGLVSADLADFDILLSGYTGSPEAVETVGRIGRDLHDRRGLRPGSFFWILDPVMGDNGRLYVDPAIPVVYRNLIPHADLILPNSFEAATLAEVEITDLASVHKAISILHRRYSVPHVIVTSLRLSKASADSDASTLAVVGSSATTDSKARPFSITVPDLPIFFSGTGDMLAALTAVRFREASKEAGLIGKTSWRPSDDIEATALPLAKAAENVLQSMHAILVKTARAREEELGGLGRGESGDANVDKQEHLRRTKASEIRVVQHADDLRKPSIEGNVEFHAVAVDDDRGTAKALDER